MMIKVAALSLLLIGASATAKTIDPTISGSWYNADQSGHGLSIEYVDENTTVIYWYVYTPDGQATFLVTAAQNQDMTASGTAFIQEGMRFGDFDPGNLSQEEWGSVSVTYNACDSITLEFDAALPGYESGLIEMQKLVSIEGVKCADNPLWGNYDVVLENASASDITVGRLAVFENGDTVFYGLGANGINPVVGSGTATSLSDSQISIEGEISTPRFGVPEPFVATGELTTNGFEVASQQLNIIGTRTDDFQLPLATSELQGDYQLTEYPNIRSGVLDISAEGSVTGRFFSQDCQFTGTTFSPAPRFNQIAIELDLFGSDCVESEIQGAGFLLPDGSMTAITFGNPRGYLGTFQR
jgi:hypothetical protein